MKLDTSRSYGQTYGADAATMALFQDDVYFTVRGNVADCHYNRDHHPELFVEAPVEATPAAGEATPAAVDDTPAAVEATPAAVDDTPAPANEPPAKPDTVEGILATKSDAEIYTAALKLRAMLDDADDPDAFVPDPSDREANTAFMLRHSGA